jgi:AcrR family transcriptional regulator
MVRKQARSLQTYERVLDAAAAEFARRGYAETNLQEVATHIGLTKGALYGHFSSKEKLAGTLVEHLARTVRELAAQDVAPGSPAFDRLRSLTELLARGAGLDVRIGAALRLVSDEIRAGSPPPDALTGLRMHAADLVRVAQADGDIRPMLPPVAVAELLLALVFGAHCTVGDGEPGDVLLRVREMWEILEPALRDR